MLSNAGLRLFTVAEYHKLAESGIVGEHERVELVEGEVVAMPPIGSHHAAAVDQSNCLFSKRLSRRAHVRVQNPVTLNDLSEPQPDVVLVQPRADGYRSAHPGPHDVFLVIEVADTTHEYDRDVKIPLYGRMRIAEAWLVDIPGDAIEVYRQPTLKGYRRMRRIRRGQSVSPLAFPDLSVTVADLLGPK